MKKVFALMMLSGFFAFTSCDSKKTSENEQVIDTDTTDVTYDVEQTVVETERDTTTKTEEVEVNKDGTVDK